MILGSLLLLASTLHAGPERPLIPAVADASPYTQLATGISAGGDTALLAWNDGGHAFVVRLDGEGRQVDPQPLRIDGAASPIVVRGAGNWLVAWLSPGAVHGVFVSDDGQLGEPRVLATGFDDDYALLRAAFDGTSFLIARGSYQRLETFRVDRSGNRISNPAALDEGRLAYAYSLDVAAFEGGGFGVTFATVETDQTYTLQTVRLDAAGRFAALETMDHTNVPIFSVHTATEGDSLLAVWATGLTGNHKVLYTRTNEPLFEIPPLHVIEKPVPFDLVQIDGRWTAVVADKDRLRLVPFNDGPERMWVTSSRVENAVAASAGGRFLLAASVVSPWSVTHGLQLDVFTAAADDPFSEETPLRLFVPDPRVQEHPAIARGANGESFAVWTEWPHEPAPRVVTARLDRDGRVIGEPVTLFGLVYATSRAWVASDGSGYLAIAQNQFSPFGQRFAADGTRVGAPILLPYAGTGCVAWSGSEYVIGVQFPVARQTTEVRFARLGPDGALGLFQAAGTSGQPRGLVCTGGNGRVLLAWEQDEKIETALVSSGGAVPVSLGAAGKAPVVATNGHNFAVAWYAEEGIRRAIVTAAGSVVPVDEPAIAAAPPLTENTYSLASLGQHYLLAFTTAGRLRAAELSATGGLLGVPFDLTSGTERAGEPVLAGGNAALLLYKRELGTMPPDRWRLFTRTISPEATRRRAVATR
ncbi:MAG TPA: hypothetical protein VEK57_19355 [Thermoanaerobaculia bacterium]|nr:hypothetical protein [Thermoanaerobaculia bacterium]